MKIMNIIKYTDKPKIYTKGSSVIWTDEYISKQLLNIHLNKEIDLGSRKEETIKSTVKWILEKVDKAHLNILDLGCGPGLYAELLVEKGHNVTGVDFSKSSIEYARKEASKKKLDIKYMNENYFKLELEENAFDLVILIYTDFGILLPHKREKLLSKINKILKPGGIFIFDVLNDKNIESKTAPLNWETTEKGFWKDEPYLVLSNSFLYEKEKVILYQHNVIDENDNLNTYRFWTHFFSHADLTEILTKHNFSGSSFYENVLPESDLWNGDNVTFCKAVNNRQL